MPRINVNGVTLHYEEHGLGPVVVLCHGYNGSHQDWMHQLPALVARYRVLTTDHRGHGSSEAPSERAAYSIPLFAADVIALTDALGIDKFSLVGHSMGGFIALRIAVDFRHRLRSLVLVDTAAGAVEMPQQRELRAELERLARSEGMAAVFDYNASHNPLALKGYELFPWHRELARRRMTETSVDGYIYAGRAMGRREDLTAALPEIDIPALVIVGAEDEPFRRPSELLAEGIPGARLMVIDGAAHSPTEECPSEFNRVLIDFLDGVDHG